MKKIKVESPYPISPQYTSWTSGTIISPTYQFQTPTTSSTTTWDGYENITIKDLVYKINEICNYLQSLKKVKKAK